MKCNYLLANKKCSLISHMKVKVGFSIGEKDLCNYDKRMQNCKYYENETEGFERYDYEEYVEGEYKSGFTFEKLERKKYFENEGE